MLGQAPSEKLCNFSGLSDYQGIIKRFQIFYEGFQIQLPNEMVPISFFSDSGIWS